MTDPKVAALAVDLGLKLGSDLQAPRRRRKPGEPVQPLRWTKEGISRLEQSLDDAGPHEAEAASTAISPSHHLTISPSVPLVPDDTDDIVEYTPTSADYRRVMKDAGWRAVYIAGPETAVPTVMAGLELWPFCVGTTASPRDIKRIAQNWSWHAVALHAVLWCETPEKAESLKTMLIDALDFRHHHLAFRFFSLEPMKAKALALEVAGKARIPVFEEAQRLDWLQRAVRLTAEERQAWLRQAVGEAVKRIGGRR